MSLYQGNSPIIGVPNPLTRPLSAYNHIASDVLDDVRVGCGEAHEAIHEAGQLLTAMSRSPYSLLQTYVASMLPQVLSRIRWSCVFSWLVARFRGKVVACLPGSG